MNNFIMNFMKGEMGRMWIIFFLLAVASGYFSFGGMSVEAETFIELARATVFAFASGLAIYVFWHFAIKIVPFLKKRRQIIAAWVTVVCSVIGIIFISSMMNITSFAGKDAAEMYLRQTLQEYTETLRVTYEDAQKMSSLGADLAISNIKYEGLKSDEYRFGLFSLTGGGTGAVHRSLVNISGSINQLSIQTVDFGRDIEKLHKSASGHLKEMRRIRLLDKSLPYRMRLIEERSILLAKDLADMNPRLLAQSIRRTADRLPDEIDVRGMKYSRNPETARKQRDAIDRLIEDVERTSENLSTISQEIIESKRKVLQQFEPVSPSRATRIMWVDFLPHWVAAIAIDCIGLPILILLSVVFSGKTEEDIEFDIINGLTVKDLLHASLADGTLRIGLKDPRGMKRLAQYSLGQHSQNEGEDHE